MPTPVSETVWTHTDSGDYVRKGFTMVKQMGHRYYGGATGYSPIYALYRYADGNPSYLPHPPICIGTFSECDAAYRETTKT